MSTRVDIADCDAVAGAGLDQPSRVLTLTACDTLQRIDRRPVADLLHHRVAQLVPESGVTGQFGLVAERAAYGAPKISFTWTEVRNSLQLAPAPSACPLLRGQPTGPEHCRQIEPVHQPQLVRCAGGRRRIL